MKAYLAIALIILLPLAFADLAISPIEWSLFVVGGTLGALTTYLALVGINTILETPLVWLLNRHDMDGRDTIATNFLANVCSGIIPALIIPYIYSLVESSVFFWAVFGIVEIGVVVIEAELYRKMKFDKKGAYTTSAVSNAFSAAIGVAVTISISKTNVPAYASIVTTLFIIGLVGAAVGTVYAAKEKDRTETVVKPMKEMLKALAILVVTATVIGALFGILVGQEHPRRITDPNEVATVIAQSIVSGGSQTSWPVTFKKGDYIDLQMLALRIGTSSECICPGKDETGQFVMDSNRITYAGTSAYTARIEINCGPRACPECNWDISCSVSIVKKE